MRADESVTLILQRLIAENDAAFDSRNRSFADDLRAIAAPQEARVVPAGELDTALERAVLVLETFMRLLRRRLDSGLGFDSAADFEARGNSD